MVIFLSFFLMLTICETNPINVQIYSFSPFLFFLMHIQLLFDHLSKQIQAHFNLFQRKTKIIFENFKMFSVELQKVQKGLFLNSHLGQQKNQPPNVLLRLSFFLIVCKLHQNKDYLHMINNSFSLIMTPIIKYLFYHSKFFF